MKFSWPRRLPRPFANAHVTLFIGLLVAWEFMLQGGSSCGKDWNDGSIVLVTATLCLAGWIAHLRAGSGQGWRRLGRITLSALYDLSVFLLLVAVFVIPFAIMLPAADCVTDRVMATEVLLSAISVRTEIADRYAERKTLSGIGQGLSVPPSKHLASGLVTQDGTIIVAGNLPPVVFALTPVAQDGKLEWKCLGAPSSLMPYACKS